jgi:hypothetical protein
LITPPGGTILKTSSREIAEVFGFGVLIFTGFESPVALDCNLQMVGRPFNPKAIRRKVFGETVRWFEISAIHMTPAHCCAGA